MRPLCKTFDEIVVLDDAVKQRKLLDKNLKLRNLVAVYNVPEVRGRPIASRLEARKIVNLPETDSRNEILFIVQLLAWNVKHSTPFGYVSQVLRGTEKIIDTQNILNLMYDIPSFIEPAAVDESCTKTKRDGEDTGQCDDKIIKVITIDANGTRVYDDAFSVIEVKENVYHVGIHVTDASRCVDKGSACDNRARTLERTCKLGASFASAAPMLPGDVRQRCSLKAPGCYDTISVVFEVDIRSHTSTSDVVRRRDIGLKRVKVKRNVDFNDAQKIINDTRRLQTIALKGVDLTVWRLHRVAEHIRRRRLGEASNFYGKEFAMWPDAGRLVEELSLLANREIARFLHSVYPNCTLFRRHSSPQRDKIKTWIDQLPTHTCSIGFRLQQYRLLSQLGVRLTNPLLSWLLKTVENQGIQDSQDLWRNGLFSFVFGASSSVAAIEAALAENDVVKVKQIIGTEETHSRYSSVLQRWYRIQERAEFVCAGPDDGVDDLLEPAADLHHFQLQFEMYLQFTSPLRRYMDLVVHRLVRAALTNARISPYSGEEINELCFRINPRRNRRRRYEDHCGELATMTSTANGGDFVTCEVLEFDDSSLTLSVSTATVVIPYRDLWVNQISFCRNKQKLTLIWDKCIYDAQTGGPLMIRGQPTNNGTCEQRIDHRLPSFDDQVETEIDEALRRNDDVVVRELICRRRFDVSKLMVDGWQTSGTDDADELVATDYYVKFPHAITPGVAVQVQVGKMTASAALSRNWIVELFHLTDELDFCLLHRKDPGGCFAKLPTLRPLTVYYTVKRYQDTWLPLLALEAATDAATSGNPIVCSNVWMSLKRPQTPVATCTEGTLTFTCCTDNLKLVIVPTEVLLCVRYRGQTGKTWIIHGGVDSCEISDTSALDKSMTVTFKIFDANFSPPPAELNRMKVKCAVELLPLSLPDRLVSRSTHSRHY